MLQDRLSSMWTPRKRKSATLSTQSSLMISWGISVFFLLPSIISSLVFEMFKRRLLAVHYVDSRSKWESCCGGLCVVNVLPLLQWLEKMFISSASMRSPSAVPRSWSWSCCWWDAEHLAIPAGCCCCPCVPQSSACSLIWPLWCLSSDWLELCCRDFGWPEGGSFPLVAAGCVCPLWQCLCSRLSVNSSRFSCSKECYLTK